MRTKLSIAAFCAASIVGFSVYVSSAQAMNCCGHFNILEQESLSNNDILKIAGNKNDSIAIDKAVIGIGARNFVDSMAKRAIGFISNPDITKAQKEASFKTLLEDSFSMKTIGRFSLGRYWRASSKAERTEYQKLFNDMVVSVYTNRFSEYKGQKFETVKHRPEGTKDTIVTSYVTSPSTPKIQVDWRVRYKNGSYKIVDIVIEGVSMSVTQRSEFSSVIQRGGGSVQVLLKHLRAR